MQSKAFLTRQLLRSSPSTPPLRFLTPPPARLLTQTLTFPQAVSSKTRSIVNFAPLRMSSSEPNQAQQQQQGEKLAQLSPEKMPRFQKTPLGANPLGEGNYVKTAACLIIGDEVLNGKTKDSNSNYFAKFCFNLGIELKKIEVIPDEEDVIVEAARRLTSQHELVITSGGIGPTPDDITYQSIAKAFDAEPLVYHDETLDRMSKNIAARRLSDAKPTDEMILARKRMALFPSKDVEVIFPTEQLWVPVVRMKGRLCILPGVPRLFEGLLDGLESYIPIDPNRPRPYRMLIHTMLPESNISPFLVRLTEKCKPEGIKVGSYPKWNNGVDVSLIGDNLDRLKELGQEVEKELDGKILEAGKIGESKI